MIPSVFWGIGEAVDGTRLSGPQCQGRLGSWSTLLAPPGGTPMMAELVELAPPARTCVEAVWKLWNSWSKVWLGGLIPVRNQTVSCGRLGFVSRCVWADGCF